MATNEKCYECGNTFVQDEMFHYNNSWVCGGCKPIFLQKVKEGVNVSKSMNYAGFWIRFLAKFIDGIIIKVVQTILQTIGIGAMLSGATNR